MAYKIRERWRCGRPREAYGEHVEWHEYQVVEGRHIVRRFDTREQAERWIAEHAAAATA